MSTKTILRSNYFQVPVFILSILLICGFIIPEGIMLFFKGLLFMINNPLISLIVSGAFLLGCAYGSYNKSK